MQLFVTTLTEQSEIELHHLSTLYTVALVENNQLLVQLCAPIYGWALTEQSNIGPVKSYEPAFFQHKFNAQQKSKEKAFK